LIDGNVTEEEKQRMRNYLLTIMRQSERPYHGEKKTEARLKSNSNMNIQKTE
jgi:hypothetical protein